MNLTIENILLVGSFLLFLSVIAGKTSFKFGIPTLILFLATGMLAGSQGVAGIEKAGMIFNIVFFVSLTSVLLQGTTLTVVAKWLNVVLPEYVKPRKGQFEILMSEEAKNIIREITIPASSLAANRKIVDLKFPKSAIIAIIKRGDQYITPHGSTVLRAGDKLVVLSDNTDSIREMLSCIDHNHGQAQVEESEEEIIKPEK